MCLVFIYLFLKQFFFFVLLLFIFGCSGSLLCPWVSLCSGLSFCRAWALGYGLRSCNIHRLRCPAACGIFLDQGSNLCPLPWQVDSKPLDHQGSPKPLVFKRASQVALVVKNLPANAGGIQDSGLIPELGRSPGGGHGNPLQYSCLANPMDRGAWWAAVHGASGHD